MILQARDDLRRVRDWAQEKIRAGQEPPWAWYQYMKLVEAADAILAGMAATTALEDSQQLAEHPATHLRLAARNGSQDTSQYRSGQPPSGPLPA